jgi:hypothetical protein
MISKTTQQVPITPTSVVDSTISCEDYKSGSNANVKVFNPSFRLVLAFASLSIISLAAALDATSLSVALSVLASELNGTTIEAFWSGTSFLVTSTVFQPFYVSLSNIFGRKQLILVALLHCCVSQELFHHSCRTKFSRCRGRWDYLFDGSHYN